MAADRAHSIAVVPAPRESPESPGGGRRGPLRSHNSFRVRPSGRTGSRRGGIPRPGLLTTVQDLGRHGYAKFGVGPGGAMDRDALRIGNLLVSNEEGAAGLEITIGGPDIEFDEDSFIALCGANLSPRIAGVPIPNWRGVFVQRGAILSFGDVVWGCRAYLAIAGGIDVPEVMGSRSTHLRAALGGH